MSRFNFTNISLADKADITQIMNNFTIIENLGITANEVEAIRKTLADSIATNASNITSNATAISGKAPTSHASTATTYGVGNQSNYGHCKIVDNLTATAYAAGEALGAYQGKLLNDKITTLNNSLGGLAKKKYSIGTAAPSGGSNGDIYDQYF